MRQWLMICMACLLAWGMVSPPAMAVDTSLIRNVWLNLDRTENQCDTLYDYFPDGGIRIFYCHLKTFIDYETLLRLAGVSAFRAGPHTDERLDLDARFGFGRYNPDFVRWLVANAVPAAEDPAFRRVTQPLFDRYVAPLAKTAYVTHEELMTDPAVLQREKEIYLSGIRSRTLPEPFYEKYYDFKGLFSRGHDGNVVKTCVAFWLRRSIDGTEPLFFAGLSRLMEVYAPGFVAGNQRTEVREMTGAAEPQSDPEPDRSPCGRLETADAELNRVYQEIRRKYSDDGPFLEALKQAQRAWIVFRDAHLKARFPAPDPQSAYGTAYHACSCAELADLTEERVDHLTQWLTRAESGSGAGVCAGSYRRE